MEREKALGDFHGRQCRVLTATSAAARQLDIENVQYIISFDILLLLTNVFIEFGVPVIVGTLAELFPFLRLNQITSSETTVRCLSRMFLHGWKKLPLAHMFLASVIVQEEMCLHPSILKRITAAGTL